MSDPASRQAALIAAAALIGPAIPPAMVVNRPHEAATALTRMADLLLPWLETGQHASPSTTSAEAAETATERVPQREEDNDGGNTGPSPETQ
jgi:hypothetical protein